MNPSHRFPELFALPAGQRQQLAEELWDSIEADAHALQAPDWQIEELKRRAARFAAGDQQTYTWEQVKQMLREGECASVLTSPELPLPNTSPLYARTKATVRFEVTRSSAPSKLL